MAVPDFVPDATRLHAPLPIWHSVGDEHGWVSCARAVADCGGRLIALWGSERGTHHDERFAVCAAYVARDALVWAELALPGCTPETQDSSNYPSLVPWFACAERMQRALADLLGLRARDGADARPWLDHGAWIGAALPLRRHAPVSDPAQAASVRDYAFVRVEGDGVHEIPVGPVHAGIIEPGHFRFSVVGEKVLRLEQRLGYVHKGIERRFTELSPFDAHRLAGRVSGDTTVAYAWAYCMELESTMACEIPPRAGWLRALMLERERVANHLGDLGALGNDAALSFGLAQFSRLKEDWLRLSKEAFGHRMLMDCVVPGGVAVDLDERSSSQLLRQCDAIEREVRLLRAVYDEHAGLQDRFMTTGQVTAALAQRLGLTGLAARASGIPTDLRHDLAWFPYDKLAFRMATHHDGDVAARVAIRFDELFESLRLMRLMLGALPGGALRSELPRHHQAAFGAGWVEGWRGEVFVALELSVVGGEARIRRCHCHDPSWQNCPVLEHAVIGNIVPDFPLINKSFNLSYAGYDL